MLTASNRAEAQGILVYEITTLVNDELQLAFLQYRIFRFEDVDADTDWHPEKKQQMERLICEKPLENRG